MTSRILIVSTSRQLAPQPAVPIGAAWVAEALHLAGFQVKLLDLCFQPDPFGAIASTIDSFRPDGIGLSVRNLDNCDFLAPRSFLPELREITDFIKSRSGARILLGGAGVSIMPVEVLEYLDLDHAVVGAGERAALEFFSHSGSGPVPEIAGLVSRGVTRQSHRPAVVPVPVMPRLPAWVEAKKYLKHEPVLPVQGKRGCANRCLYCTYHRIEGEGWRMREPGSVVEEICQAMRDSGAREFEFVDSVFNEPEGYLEALLEEIVSSRVKARFRASSLSPKGLTGTQVRLLERAGFSSLVITPESASDRTLASLNKGFTEKEVADAAALFGGSKIRALWCFLLGAPGEDRESLAKTIGFINGRITGKDAAFITTGIRVYPNTPLHALAVEEGIVERADNLLMPTFYFSPAISPKAAGEELRKGVLDLSRCIFVSDTDSGSLKPLRRLGVMLRLPGPFWRYATYVNKLGMVKTAMSRDWSGGAAVEK